MQVVAAAALVQVNAPPAQAVQTPVRRKYPGEQVKAAVAEVQVRELAAQAVQAPEAKK